MLFNAYEPLPASLDALYKEDTDRMDIRGVLLKYRFIEV